MRNKTRGRRLLAAALALALCAATAFAAAPDGSEADGQEGTAGEESREETAPEYIPDPAGTVSYENLERRMRENNLTLLALEESIQAIEVIDYEEMADDYRQALNDIADQQWGLITGGLGVIPGLSDMLSASLDAQYDALRESFDAIQDGELQKENADLVWQLESTQNQLVMAGQALYIGMVGAQLQGAALDRTLESTDRSIQELELRYELGQISTLTLEQARAGRVSLVSNMQTLDMTLENLGIQLKQMIGADLASPLTLEALPQVTGGELAAMDLEADLAAAKEASYSLHDARLTLDDAEETFDDAPKNKNSYEYQMALHQWQGAQYTYQATVQSFETSFRTLYNQVKDCKQLLDTAETALAVEESNYEVDALKYEQGSISRNELLTAQDDLETARDAVDTAAVNLFSTYSTYRWAVEYGILNVSAS